jgi:hypothetical protein
MAGIDIQGWIHDKLYRAPDGFHWGTNGSIAFCSVLDLERGDQQIITDRDLVNLVKQSIGSQSLDYFYFSGYFGIKISAQERHLIPSAIQEFLDRGRKVMMNDGSKLVIVPPFQYNRLNRERLFLEKLSETRNMYPDIWRVTKDCLDFDCKIAGRYQLPEMKQFCLQEFPKENMADHLYDDIDKKFDRLEAAYLQEHRSDQNAIEDRGSDQMVDQDHGSDHGSDQMVDQDHGTDHGKDHGSDHMMNFESEGLCIMCEEREAGTLLDPCDHILVCEPCSDQLIDNPKYNSTCIMCQQPIHEITYVKSGKVRKID